MNNIIKDIKALVVSRNILFSMVRKELFGRYKNSALGFAWHFITPAITMAIYFTVFTSGIRSSPLDNYSVFLTSGLFGFTFMVTNIGGGAGCITANAGMVKKMSFPREILILSHVMSTFIVMIIGYLLVFAYIILTGFDLNIPSALCVVPILVLEFFFVTGYVFLFSSINVYVRDVQYILSSINMVFFFGTPMYFVSNEVTGILSTLIWLNPLTYFVESLHKSIYYGTIPDFYLWISCSLLALLTFIIGYMVFRKLKRGFAERL